MTQSSSGEGKAKDSNPPAGEPSDHSLLRRYRAGSQDAATLLYLRYAKRLRALAKAQCSPQLAHRLEVEDIVQSTFRSFFRGASRGLYEVPDGEELWKLFLVIALNKIRARGAYHRAAKRDMRRTTSGESGERALEELSHEDSACVFLQLTIDEALDRLPPHQKQMVQLRIEGYEVAEIADKVGRSKRTVERGLQEAKQVLRVLLDEAAVHDSRTD